MTSSFPGIFRELKARRACREPPVRRDRLVRKARLVLRGRFEQKALRHNGLNWAGGTDRIARTGWTGRSRGTAGSYWSYGSVWACWRSRSTGTHWPCSTARCSRSRGSDQGLRVQRERGPGWTYRAGRADGTTRACRNATFPPTSQDLSGALSTNGGVAFLGSTAFIYAATSSCVIGDVILSVNGYGQGALPADRGILPISGNVAVFSLIGTNFGGDGVTNFALPDLRRFAPQGLQYSICVLGIFPSRF